MGDSKVSSFVFIRRVPIRRARRCVLATEITFRVSLDRMDERCSNALVILQDALNRCRTEKLADTRSFGGSGFSGSACKSKVVLQTVSRGFGVERFHGLGN
jgi:hypothetical protein